MSATNAGTTTDQNTAAILTALRLVNPDTAPVTTGRARPPALPSAKARIAIDTFAGSATYVEFNERRLNTKQLLGDALSWHGTNRLTKVVNKAVLGAMSSIHEPTGISNYPQGVEMLSYLMLCAPMLEPDRLARIAALAAETPNAYRPIRYMVAPTAQLQKVLARYPDNRKEELLASLWVTAHDGRWWNSTAGAAPGTRRRRRHEDDRTDEERAAIEEQIAAVFKWGIVPSAHTVSDAFSSRLLTFSDDAAQVLGGMSLLTQADHRELTYHVNHPDADVPVLLSYIRQLTPDERPESPIPMLVDTLLTSLGDDLTEDGALPDRPESWAELYPAVSRESFPMPEQLTGLDRTAVPGLAGSTVVMMRNAALLRANATHMGNCTFSYRQQSERGTAFIGRLEWRTTEYNFAVHNRTADLDGPPLWTLGEVNSRFNRGAVPAEVNRGLQELLAQLRP